MLERINDDECLLKHGNVCLKKNKRSSRSGYARQQCLVEHDAEKIRDNYTYLSKPRQSLSKHDDNSQKVRKDSQKAREAALSGEL